MLPTSIDYGDHLSGATSLLDPSYTYSYSKYSCSVELYFAHVVCSYIVFFSGLVCLITRCLPPKFKASHAFFGRVYVCGMLWNTGTSVLINNTGLPLANLISFAFVLGACTLGWFTIAIYRAGVQRQALADLSTSIVKESGANHGFRNLEEELKLSTANVLARQTFKQRMLSLKSLHGALFFASWFQIGGRIFASDQSGSFTCHTYPVFKPIATKAFNGTVPALTLVPAEHPNAARLPWVQVGGDAAWNAITVGGALLIAVVGLAIAACLGAKRDNAKLVANAHNAIQLSPSESNDSSGAP